jgi:hypothetical protein
LDCEFEVRECEAARECPKAVQHVCDKQKRRSVQSRGVGVKVERDIEEVGSGTGTTFGCDDAFTENDCVCKLKYMPSRIRNDDAVSENDNVN